MRSGALWLGAALLVVSAAGADDRGAAPPPLPPPLAADPPPRETDLDAALEQLRSARSELAGVMARVTADRAAAGPPGDAALRARVAELLGQLKAKKAPAPPAPAAKAATPPPDPLARPAAPAADQVALVQLHFRNRDYAAALAAVAAADRGELSPADQAWLDYLKACCLRQQDKLSEAAAAYREVAANKADRFLAEMAAWQLNLLRWRQEAQAQLDGLARRNAEGQP